MSMDISNQDLIFVSALDYTRIFFLAFEKESSSAI